MLCLLHFAKRFSAQACFLTLHVPSVDVTFTIFFSCCRCFCYLRYEYISVLDTPLINKITKEQTNKKKITIKKNDFSSRVPEKTRKLKNTKTKHLKALLTHPVKYLSFFYSCLQFLKQEEKKKTKTLRGCAWSEATSVMHGYYQTAETRHTFLYQDSRYTSSVLCEDSRIQFIAGMACLRCGSPWS